ncbi:MAG: phosphate acyltransferase PlsX [Dehalococcoidales bacterium]|nr:phosphate acyltransferase PlsX [Dehalococcoidales bacterium]
MKIFVDAMGGDFAPAEVVKGAVEAARKLGVEIILVGEKKAVEAELAREDVTGLPVSFVEAAEVIKEGENPAYAVLQKKNSSIAVAAGMVRRGGADAMVSAGSTGAVNAAAVRYVGTLAGVDRPMAGGAFLQLSPKTVVLDLGANVDCQPYHMVDFAVAGTVYARSFLGIENPTVGLLSVGAEEGKGNAMTKEAYTLLKRSGLNFIGNVEGMDIPFGRANVVVCDGFVGNILVKFCEGLGRVVSRWLGAELKDSLDAARLEAVSTRLYRLLSPGLAVGGGPLWGVNGVVAIAHGVSRAPQIYGTIEQAKLAVSSGFVAKLAGELEKARARLAGS